jgi:hypothetical protein
VDAPAFDVRCPCCQATLTVDPGLRAVVAHAPAAGPAARGSLDQAVTRVRDAAGEREARFREAAEAERAKRDVLARKFAAGLDRARRSPDPPRRPYDGD